jgi:hypothetical protein
LLLLKYVDCRVHTNLELKYFRVAVRNKLYSHNACSSWSNCLEKGHSCHGQSICSASLVLRLLVIAQLSVGCRIVAQILNSKRAAWCNIAPACAGCGEGSDHLCSLSLHFCKNLFPGLEPMTTALSLR